MLIKCLIVKKGSFEEVPENVHVAEDANVRVEPHVQDLRA
jgi:hypothetical protein